jgi:hypothetical protein
MAWLLPCVYQARRAWTTSGRLTLGGFRRYPVSTGPVGTMDAERLKRVVNVMQQFLGFPNFNIDSMLMGGG